MTQQGKSCSFRLGDRVHLDHQFSRHGTIVRLGKESHYVLVRWDGIPRQDFPTLVRYLVHVPITIRLAALDDGTTE